MFNYFCQYVQDGHLQPAACLSCNNILKWYFLKYYQVCGSWVFSDLVIYLFLCMHTSNARQINPGVRSRLSLTLICKTPVYTSRQTSRFGYKLQGRVLVYTNIL